MRAYLGYGMPLSEVFSYREAERAKPGRASLGSPSSAPSPSTPPGYGNSRRFSRPCRTTTTSRAADMGEDVGMPASRHHAAVDGEQLLAAIEYVEQLLPPIGADAWPERTGQLGAAVDAVRKLTCAHPVSIDQRGTWPRPYCRHCGVHGWYWDDPDTTAHGWTPAAYVSRPASSCTADPDAPGPRGLGLSPGTLRSSACDLMPWFRFGVSAGRSWSVPSTVGRDVGMCFFQRMIGTVHNCSALGPAALPAPRSTV